MKIPALLFALSSLLFLRCSSSKKQAALQKTCCQCITELAEKPAALDRIGDCVADVYAKKIRSFKTEKERDDFLMFLHMRFMRSCPAYERLIYSNKDERNNLFSVVDTVTASSLSAEDCRAFITAPGKYYLESEGDTTYLHLTKNTWTDSLKGGRYYSRCGFRQDGDCGFILTFQHSNDPVKGTVHRKGDLFFYRLLKRTVAYYLVEGHVGKQRFHFKIYYQS